MDDRELAQWRAEMNRWCIAREDALEAARSDDHKLAALNDERANIHLQRAHYVITRILARRSSKLVFSKQTPTN
jgi:hypothetical protein